MKVLATDLMGNPVNQDETTLQFSFIGALRVDADGGYHAYNILDKLGDDNLVNAEDGKGGFCGVVVDKTNTPIVQGVNDPAAGYFVSTTALVNPSFAPSDPRRYVNSEVVPYVVIPSILAKRCAGIVLGSKCLVTNTITKEAFYGVVADIGPASPSRWGEVSIAMAKNFKGINPSAKVGGDDRHIYKYDFYPNQPYSGYSLQKI